MYRNFLSYLMSSEVPANYGSRGTFKKIAVTICRDRRRIRFIYIDYFIYISIYFLIYFPLATIHTKDCPTLSSVILNVTSRTCIVPFLRKPQHLAHGPVPATLNNLQNYITKVCVNCSIDLSLSA